MKNKRQTKKQPHRCFKIQMAGDERIELPTVVLNLLHIHLSNERIWRVDLDQVSPFSSNRNGIITSSSISCKFSLIVFGDDVNTLIDLSSPFFDMKYERSKIRGLRPKVVGFL